jgi:hypothetical protein
MAPATPVPKPANIAQVQMGISTPSEAKPKGDIGDDTQPAKFTPEEMQGLRDALSLLETGIDRPEIVGSAVRNVLTSLQSNPALCDILAAEDCGTMVRGLRQSYGIVIAKKDEKVSRSAAKDKIADDLMAGLDFTI